MNPELKAHRECLRTVIFGSMKLDSRRKINTPPLRKVARLLDSNMFERISRECEGIAHVSYFGHPSRRTFHIQPFKNDREETIKAIRNATASGKINWYHAGGILYHV